jgi:hypothetical protein
MDVKRSQLELIFTQPAIALDPGDGACHHPAAWQHRKGWHRRRLHVDGVPAPALGALDDLQDPAALFFYPGAQLLAAIGHIGPDVLQPLADLIGCGQEPRRHIGIPQVGGMDEGAQEETRRLNEEMALAAIE